VATRLAVAASEPDFGRIMQLFGDFEEREQRGLCFAVARAALMQGKARIARLASARAAELSRNGGTELARARLYEGAAMLVDKNIDDGFDKLRAIGVAALPAEDAEFAAMARALAANLHAPAQFPEARQKEPQPPDLPPPTKTMESALRVLEDADRLLGKASPR
jgi:chemotaxis protein MotC